MSISYPDQTFSAEELADFQACVREQEAALSQMGQRLPATDDDGREVLWQCPYCQHCWASTGRHRWAARLSSEETALLACRLCLHSEHQPLPQALCPYCSLRFLGGVFQLELLQGIANGWCWWWSHAWSRAHFVYLLAPVGSLPQTPESWLRWPTDLVPPASLSQIKQQCIWLTQWLLPYEHAGLPLSEEQQTSLQNVLPAPTGCVWKGYRYTLVGPEQPMRAYHVLLAATLPHSSSGHSQHLVECWKNLAAGLETVL